MPTSASNTPYCESLMRQEDLSAPSHSLPAMGTVALYTVRKRPVFEVRLILQHADMATQTV